MYEEFKSLKAVAKSSWCTSVWLYMRVRVANSPSKAMGVANIRRISLVLLSHCS